jgi:hypothetical protein
MSLNGGLFMMDGPQGIHPLDVSIFLVCIRLLITGREAGKGRAGDPCFERSSLSGEKTKPVVQAL